MQIPSDACPFVDALFKTHVELPCHLMQSQLIKRPEQCKKSGHARQAEPSGLVVRWGDRKIQECARLVPHPAVVASRHAEAVAARAEVRILYLAVVDDLPPVPVLRLQLEAEVNLLRCDQAQRCVINREV